MRLTVVLMLRMCVVVMNGSVKVRRLPGLRIETWGTQLMGGLRMLIVGRVGRDDIHFGRGQAATTELVHFQARADIERGCCFFQAGKGKAGIDQRAEQHIAADSGKAFQVANSHRTVILNCRLALQPYLL
jgi:hypothetical protein